MFQITAEQQRLVLAAGACIAAAVLCPAVLFLWKCQKAKRMFVNSNIPGPPLPNLILGKLNWLLINAVC